jgi:pseudaminic acid biosynthesis-associated methylase
MSDNPLQQWQGKFGADYVERNRPDDTTTAEAAAVFGRMLTGAIGDIRSVLEVGASVGINLRGLRRLMPEASIAAVEPFAAACAELRRTQAEIGLSAILEADAFNIPAADNSFDLVFTNGVLIHVPPARLADAMREIVRVSRRFVLCSEYFSHTPVEIPYHGNTGMLWKRDFGGRYLEVAPSLRVRSYGFTWQHEFPHFDDLNWWLFEKGDVKA